MNLAVAIDFSREVVETGHDKVGLSHIEVFSAATCIVANGRVEHRCAGNGRPAGTLVGARFQLPFFEPNLRKGRLDGRDYEISRQHLGDGRHGGRPDRPDRRDDLLADEATG